VKKILTFGIFAAILLILIGRLTATAYGATSPVQQNVNIETAAAADAPQTVFYGNAHGSITPGDLFYIDLNDSTIDTRATLYITNTDILAKFLRYITLNIGVYNKNQAGGWDKCPQNNNPLLTLKNGLVEIILPGPGTYKITVDAGNYYSFAHADNQDEQAPFFNLEIEG
jgi:hypothetical protein